MKKLTPEQAIARLQPNRAPSKDGKTTVKPLELKETIGENDALYIFGNENGNILTPAYNNFRPIVAAWSSIDNIPPAAKDWFDEYANEIEWYKNIGQTLDVDSGAAVDTSKRNSISPLLACKWAQGTPFNNNLVFDGKKSLVGCGAIAVGQVLYYWGTKGYHRGCTATKAYKTETNLYDVAALSPLTVFDYANLTKGKPTAKVKIDAVAKLLEYVGKALQSDYGQGATSVYTNKIAPTLRDNLRMGSGIKELYSLYTSAANFENTIYKEIAACRPVILFGSGDKGGHFFVCDGYDATQDLYHMNWGWGGSYDGYFALTALAPTSYAFNSRKRAYVNIDPEYKLGDINKDNEIDITDAMQVIQDVNHGKTKEIEDINSDGQVTITDAMLIIDKILGKIEL